MGIPTLGWGKSNVGSLHIGFPSIFITESARGHRAYIQQLACVVDDLVVVCAFPGASWQVVQVKATLVDFQVERGRDCEKCGF